MASRTFETPTGRQVVNINASADRTDLRAICLWPAQSARPAIGSILAIEENALSESVRAAAERRDKIKFFAVIKGSCWVQLEGEPAPIHFETGDFGLLAARRSFVLASAPNVTPVNAMSLFSGSGSNTATLGSGADFAHLGGHVTLDPIRGRLLAEMLPPWIHLRAASSETTQFRHLLDWLVEERDAAQPGSRLALAQLTQLLLIQLLRTHLRTSAQIPPGWLRALADPCGTACKTDPHLGVIGIQK